MRQTSDVIKMFSCVGLDCEIRAHFFVLGMAHTDLTVSWTGPHTDLTDLTEFFF